MLSILAQACTTGLQWSTCTRFANGLHFTHQRVVVQAIEDIESGIDRSSSAKEPPVAREIGGGQTAAAGHVRTSYCAELRAYHLFQPPLIVEKWRLSAHTLSMLLSLVAPKPGHRLTIVDDDTGRKDCDPNSHVSYTKEPSGPTPAAHGARRGAYGLGAYHYPHDEHPAHGAPPAQPFLPAEAHAQPEELGGEAAFAAATYAAHG